MGRKKATAAACIVILLISAVLSLTVSSVRLSLSDVLHGLTHGGSDAAGRIMLYSRLPRLCAAALSGAGLAVSGAIIQTVLANPLASPGILGVNAGAGFFTALCGIVLPGVAIALPVAAFLGALLTVLAVYAIASRAGASRMTLILSGVAISSLMTAGINTIMTLYPDALYGLRSFQIGGFRGVTMQMLRPAGILIAIGLTMAFTLSAELDILGLGEAVALSLGLNVRAYRFVFLVLAAVLAGAAVSFAGLLGFVGLIVPHIVRLLFGGTCRWLIGMSAIIGAAFLILCDTVSRAAFAPFEIPVGIIVSFVGVPFFLWLLFRSKRRGHD